jgi:hypothetical protein
MDSSELTKSRRDRVLANSYTSQGIASRHLVPNITSSTLLSFKYGAKLVEFNKKTVLPNCGGTNGVGCTQDLIIQSDGEVTLLPPDCPDEEVLSINYVSSNETNPFTGNVIFFEPSGGFSCLEFLPFTFNVIFGPGTPTNGTFSITAEAFSGDPPLPPPPYISPVTVDPVTGLLTVPGNSTDPANATWTITYTTACGQTQWSQGLGFC